tara:strand:+ start:735 stop:857 length:123 start_codon:yes stop_codon:yes gene_type:complete
MSCTRLSLASAAKAVIVSRVCTLESDPIAQIKSPQPRSNE